MKTMNSILLRNGLALSIVIAVSASELRAEPGSLDTNFNAAAASGHWAYSLAVQPDGKVIAVGTFGVMRFLDDGSADPAFQPILPGPLPFAGAGSRLGAVKLQLDGRIIVTGSFSNATAGNLPALMRLNSDGTIDPSFHLDPRVHPAARVLALQPDGKVITSGFLAGDGDAEYVGLLRLRSDGSFDDSFNARWFNNSADIYALTLAPEGQIYFGTLTEIVRVNPDGTRDDNFKPEAFYGPFGSIAEQWNRSVLIGHYGDGPSFRSLQRFLHDGTDDPSWTVPSIDGGDHVIYALLPQPDGKVLFGGNTIYGINGTPISGLARLHPDGSPDTNFNTYSPAHYFSVEDMALAPNGKIFVAGLIQHGNGVNGIWRLNNDAAPSGIEFAAPNYVVQEGDGWVNVTVRRTTETGRLAVVSYSVRPGSATPWRDYFGGNGVLVFRPGETQKHIRIYVVRDRKAENYETVRLSLTRARGGNLGPQRQAVLTILNR